MNTYKGFVSVMLLILLLLVVGKEFIKKKTEIEDPKGSKIGEAIDEGLGFNQVDSSMSRARRAADEWEQREIQTAVVLYMTKMGEEPKTLGDLVDAGCIGRGALTDSSMRRYKLLRNGDQWSLEGSGSDGIRGTGDDVGREIQGFAVPRPPTLTPTPLRNFFELVPTPTRKWGPNRKVNQ